MRSSGFSNGAAILAALSLLILASPTTPIAQEAEEPAAASEVGEAAVLSLREEVRALREELRVARAQIQILKSTIDAVAAESAAQDALAMAKQDEPQTARTRSWQKPEAAPASTLSAALDPTGQADEARVAAVPTPTGSETAASPEGGAAPNRGQQVAALSDVEPPSEPLMIGEVHFNPGSADLSPGAQSRTVQAAESFMSMEGGKIRVVGYTDTTGSSEYNKHLALMRADSIAKLLESLGVTRERIEVIGRGEEDTPVSTDDQVAEPLNRCAGIFVVADAAN
jgi:outer membrane protein OmpA-like peptidoglycan-associated protein